MINEIIGLALEKWELVFPSMAKPHRVSYVLQSRNNVIVMLFDQRSAYPIAVVKIVRSPEETRRVQEMVERLTCLRSYLYGPILHTLPMVAVLGEVAGRLCTLETGMPGIEMAISTSNRHIAAHLRAFSDWLLAFQQQSKTGQVVLDRPLLEQKVILPIKACLGMSPEAELAEIVLERCLNVNETAMPIVWRYGDTHPSNVLLQNGRVSGVVDWSAVEPDQWAILDWFHFLFQYSCELTRKSLAVGHLEQGKAALDLLISPDGASVSVALNREPGNILSKLGLDNHLLPAMWMAFLAQLYWPHDKPELLRHALSLLTDVFAYDACH